MIKSTWGSCGFQHHTPRNPEPVLPTCASGSMQTDLGKGCRTSRSLQTGHNPFQPWLGETRRVLTWEDTHGHSAFLRIVSSTSFKTKKNTSLDTLKGTLPAQPFPQDSTAWGWPRHWRPIPRGGRDNRERVYSYTSCSWDCWRNLFLSCRTQSIEVLRRALQDRKEGRDQERGS